MREDPRPRRKCRLITSIAADIAPSVRHLPESVSQPEPTSPARPATAKDPRRLVHGALVNSSFPKREIDDVLDQIPSTLATTARSILREAIRRLT